MFSTLFLLTFIASVMYFASAMILVSKTSNVSLSLSKTFVPFFNYRFIRHMFLRFVVVVVLAAAAAAVVAVVVFLLAFYRFNSPDRCFRLALVSEWSSCSILSIA